MAYEQFHHASWSRRTPRFWRRLARTALLDLSIVVIIVVAGEAGLRIFYPESRRHIFSETLTGGHPHVMNSYGFRDCEFPRERAPNERRVICLGNSVTRGAGVALESTFAKQLEGMLSARDSEHRYFVINGGGQGASLNDALNFLQRDGLGFSPDLVVLGFTCEMLSIAQRKADWAAANRAAADGAAPVEARMMAPKRSLLQTAWNTVHMRLLSSCLLTTLDLDLRVTLYRTGIITDDGELGSSSFFAYAFEGRGAPIERVERAYQALDASLRELKTLLDKRGIPLLVLGLPSRFKISSDPRDNDHYLDLSRTQVEPIARMADFCRAANVPFLDLTPRLSEERREMDAGRRPWDPLFIRDLDFAHFNPRGHQVVAEELLAGIQARQLLPDALRNVHVAEGPETEE